MFWRHVLGAGWASCAGVHKQDHSCDRMENSRHALALPRLLLVRARGPPIRARTPTWLRRGLLFTQPPGNDPEW